MDYIKIDGKLALSGNTTYDEASIAFRDDSIEKDCLFWLDGVHTIDNVEGQFSIGLMFSQDLLKLVYISFFEEDDESFENEFELEEQKYKKLLRQLSDNIKECGGIKYEYDNRNGYGVIGIRF